MTDAPPDKKPRGRLLRRPAAAEHLRKKWGMRCSPQTLAKYAVEGKGPAFHRYGRDVTYDIDVVDAWAESRLSSPVRSTSDRSAEKTASGAEAA